MGLQGPLPPEDKVCPSCEKGRLIEEIDYKPDPDVVRYGSVQKLKRVSRGFYCGECGLMYKFIPKK